MFKFLPYVILFSFLLFPVISKGKLVVLKDDKWSETLTGEWMLEFYAPWCPACQQLEPFWKEFADWTDDLGFQVGIADTTVNPGLTGRFMISAFPTIFHVKDGVFRKYHGPRSKYDFISFVAERKWQTMDPVPRWKSPQSYPMATASRFYRIGLWMLSIHNTLVENYPVPYWGSHMLFGLLTMLAAALFGLLIGYTVVLFRRRMGYQPPKSPSTPGEKEHEEYEGMDVIRDDIEEDPGIRQRREHVEENDP